MPHDDTSLEQAVIAAFESLDWTHFDRAGWRVARVQGEHSSYEMAFRGHGESGLLLGFCLIPVRVPAEHRPAVAETVVRANFGLALGGFDMDFADGELRYRVSVDVEGGALTPTMVQNMIFASLSACDRFFGAFMRVIHAGIAPEAAIAAIAGAGAPQLVADEAGEGETAQPRPDPVAMERAVQELLASLDATVRDEEPDDEEPDDESPDGERRDRG